MRPWQRRDHGARRSAMNCKAAISVLAEFLEQSLSVDLVGALEEHLADCAPCRAYLATYRRTVALTGRAEGVKMPHEMKTRLRQLLLGELRRSGEPA
jgi:anti-sigma factor RsiW